MHTTDELALSLKYKNSFFRGEPKHTIKQGPNGQLFVFFFCIRVIKEANRRKAVLNNSPK